MYVLVYFFGRSSFMWLLLVCERLCVCVPCLRYPRKGKIPRVYHYYYYNVVILVFFKQKSDPNL